jgi:hypothetical protein
MAKLAAVGNDAGAERGRIRRSTGDNQAGEIKAG